MRSRGKCMTPPMNRRNVEIVVNTRGVSSLQDARRKALPRNCGNQSLRWKGRSTSGEDREARLPTRSTGTDRSVLATKARNGAGAEGSHQEGCHRRN